MRSRLGELGLGSVVSSSIFALERPAHRGSRRGRTGTESSLALVRLPNGPIVGRGIHPIMVVGVLDMCGSDSSKGTNDILRRISGMNEEEFQRAEILVVGEIQIP